MEAPNGKVMWVTLDWIEAHCIVPDGFRAGEPFRLYKDQGRYLANFYMVRPDAYWDEVNPILGPAFVNRRALLVAPQKWGKNPLIATQVCVEGVGPALFAGWAGKDDGYACADHGCRCGWERPYEPGEPMGMQWPTPLIQITAFSEDSTGNTYDALRPMID
ncbi:MAG: terminase, partial [Acidobacteria bacterium]|nr:terminase [Acidobacteriota bacterium]